MPDIDFIRGEIERMRVLVLRQRKDILSLQRAGIPTTAADALLQRMLDKIDALCAEREKLRAEQPRSSRRVLGGRTLVARIDIEQARADLSKISDTVTMMRDENLDTTKVELLLERKKFEIQNLMA